MNEQGMMNGRGIAWRMMLACGTAAGVMMLSACGGGDDGSSAPDDAMDAAEGGASIAMDAAQHVAGDVEDGPGVMPEVEEGTPEATVAALSAAMKEGDFLTAAQHCHPESEMFGQLLELAEQLEQLRVREESGESSVRGVYELGKQVIVGPWREVSWSDAAVRDANAKMDVTFANGMTREFDLALVDGSWLVNVPSSAFPLATDAVDNLPPEVPMEGPPAPPTGG